MFDPDKQTDEQINIVNTIAAYKGIISSMLVNMYDMAFLDLPLILRTLHCCKQTALH